LGVSSWYFGQSEGEPANPALQGAKWAFTSSSGAVAQAAIIQTIVEKLKKEAKKCSCGPVSLLARCIISMIGDAVDAMSRFSLIAHAVYGGGLWETAKGTWRLLKDHLGDAVATNNVAQYVMSFTTSFVTVALSFSTFLMYGAAFGGNYDITTALGNADASSITWILLGYTLLANFVAAKPMHFIILLVFIETFAGSAIAAGGSNWYAMIGGSMFITAVAGIVLHYFAMVVLHAADAVFFCYAVEKHNNKTQERHSNLYAMMSTNIVLVEATEVRTVSAV